MQREALKSECLPVIDSIEMQRLVSTLKDRLLYEGWCDDLRKWCVVGNLPEYLELLTVYESCMYIVPY